MKRLISVLLAVIMVMAMSSSVFAAGISKTTAQNKALKSANVTKAKVTSLRTKLDDGRYEVDFRRKSDGAKFSFEIGRSNGRIYEKSVDFKYRKTTSKKKIGVTKAQTIAAKAAGLKVAVVKKGKCRYEYDDRHGTYDVKFKNGKYAYDIEIQAATGKLLEYGWEYKGR